MSNHPPRPWPRAAVLAGALALGGCLDSNTEVHVHGSISTDVGFVKRVEASPRGAPVAFTSLDGAPQALTGRFAQALATDASGREITIADPKSAHYFVRGYLSAYPADDGTAVAYVWDVFDADHRRLQRVTDAVLLKGTAADPWSLVDDGALDSVAAKSADDLAGFLATTPEAVAAAAQLPAKVATASAEAAPAGPGSGGATAAGAKPLSYAPAE